jgi:ABC-type transport system substrate-binding protein
MSHLAHIGEGKTVNANWQSKKILVGTGPFNVQVSDTEAGISLTVSFDLTYAAELQLTDDQVRAVRDAMNAALAHRAGDAR